MTDKIHITKEQAERVKVSFHGFYICPKYGHVCVIVDGKYQCTDCNWKNYEVIDECII